MSDEYRFSGSVQQAIAGLRGVAESMDLEWRIMLAGREIERSPGFTGGEGSITFHLDEAQ